MRAGFVTFAALCAFLVLSGCQSAPMKLGAAPGRAYDTLGKGEGSATGIMLFNVIPIGQNNRFERAYRRAVQEAGGDDMINVEIQESWFWAYVMNGYTTHFRGDVIKYK